ncbi:hypothetical protein E4T56_gene12034 [Termitomyces sp. T112]|nr:hypothetical protein E4T56_gene12034 [Termitomyces sp. T112]
MQTNLVPVCLGVDEDVVKIYAHYTFGNEVLEDVLHHYLEGGWTIGGLPLVSFLDAHIVVAPPDIQFGKVPHTLEVVDELRNEEERIAVLHSHGIENLVVLDQLEQAIILLDEED